jgi:hypothetical protein
VDRFWRRGKDRVTAVGLVAHTAKAAAMVALMATDQVRVRVRARVRVRVRVRVMRVGGPGLASGSLV